MEDDLWKQFDAIQATVPEPDENVSCCSSMRLIIDEHEAHLVCENCGRIHEKTFSAVEDNINYEPGENKSHHGFARNPLLSSASEFGTQINTKNIQKYKNLTMYQARCQKIHRDLALLKSFEIIQEFCENLSLPMKITEGAKRIYKLTVDHKIFRGNIRTGMKISSILLACVDNGYPRTVREVARLCNIDKQIITKTQKKLNEIIWKTENYKKIIYDVKKPSDFVIRFASNIESDRRFAMKCFSLCVKFETKCEDILFKFNPEHIAASVLFILDDHNTPLGKISAACHLSNTTILKYALILNETIEKLREQ